MHILSAFAGPHPTLDSKVSQFPLKPNCISDPSFLPQLQYTLILWQKLILSELRSCSVVPR